MNAKYNGYSLTLKSIAFVPSILAFCIFGYLLWLFGLEENPDEVLVHRYRRDVRHHRQMKRLRKKKRMEERKNKEMEEGEVGVSGLRCSWMMSVFFQLNHHATRFHGVEFYQKVGLVLERFKNRKTVLKASLEEEFGSQAIIPVLTCSVPSSSFILPRSDLRQR